MEDKVVIAVQLVKTQAQFLHDLLTNGNLHQHGIAQVDSIRLLEGDHLDHFQKLVSAAGIIGWQEELTRRRNTFVLKVKKQLSTDIETAIDTLGEQLNPDAKVYNEFVLLSEKFHRINRSFLSNLVSFEESNREISKISNTIIWILDELQLTDLRL